MTARVLAFLLWALVAASATYWALRVTDRPAPLPPGALMAGTVAPQGSVVSVLGSPAATAVAVVPAAAAPAANNPAFRLVGVIASGGAAGRGSDVGVALIAIGQQPPRAYPVGAEVAPGWFLQTVERRRAIVQAGPQGPVSELQLPELP